MTHDRSELKLDGHVVSGTVKISGTEQGQAVIRATLDIPRHGPL